MVRGLWFEEPRREARFCFGRVETIVGNTLSQFFGQIRFELLTRDVPRGTFPKWEQPRLEFSMRFGPNRETEQAFSLIKNVRGR